MGEVPGKAPRSSDEELRAGVRNRQRADGALWESEGWFRTLTDTLPQLIWSATAEGRLDYLSEQWGEFTGLDQADVQSWKWEELIHPDDFAGTRREWVQHVQSGEPYEMSQRLRHHSGEWRWILTRARPVRGGEGQIRRWVGTCTDIHEQLMTERELWRLNTDLDSFRFAAAHDLQEPLRMVTSYTQLLGRRFEGRLDADEREMMGYVVDGAKRISLLIRDLWSYTAVSRTMEHPAESVDLNRALRRALEQLSSAIDETASTIERRPLPKVTGYESQFVQLFQNLIENALKYRSSNPPEIKVEARREGQEWIVSVQDNGIGIEANYHRQIFGIFKRLHSQQIPGTGIGLAICQRVVERSGGRIWVDSAGTGQGSTFRFTLPVAESSNS